MADKKLPDPKTVNVKGRWPINRRAGNLQREGNATGRESWDVDKKTDRK